MRTDRSPLVLALAATLTLVLACGSGSSGDNPTPTVGDGSVTPIAKVVLVTAEQNLFDLEEITVPAGSDLAIAFTNDDPDPHNIAFYYSSAAEEEIYVGETFSGPGETATYQFDAPAEPGTYFFRCDVHPVDMTGDFIVE